MDLYFSRMSGNSARVVFALLESGARWNPHPVDPRARENRSAEYLAVNPMGKLPALRDEALTLWESNAINWYVAEKHPEARLLPASLGERAAVQRWLFFQAGHITPASMQIFRVRNPRVQAFWNLQGEERGVEQGERELARFLPVLEQSLEGRDWLERDFSLADIAYAPHSMLL
jgi:glutathione S-transferase